MKGRALGSAVMFRAAKRQRSGLASRYARFGVPLNIGCRRCPVSPTRRNRPFVERAKTDGAPPAEIPRIAISLRSILPSFASEHERRPDSGWANSGGFFASSIAISARRSATARPIVGSFFSSSSGGKQRIVAV